MWTTIITGVVKGLIEPLIQWWSTYYQGRNAQKADDLEASLRKLEEVVDAVSKVRPGEYYVDPYTGRVCRRDPDPPPGVPSGSKPNTE